MPTNRSFGIFFCLVFLSILAYFFVIKNVFLITIFFLFLITIILTLFKPLYLYPFNLFWINFGLFLNRIFAPLIIGIIYFLLVVPIGLLAKLLNFDLINVNLKKTKSYWIKEKIEKVDYTKE